MGIVSYIIPFLAALILHGGLLLLLIPHWFHQEDPYRRTPRHIQAEMIDLKTLSNQENLQKNFQEEQKQRAEQEKKRIEIEQQHQNAIAKQQAEKVKQQLEAQQKAEAKQKAVVEQQRKAAEVQKLAKLKEQQLIADARKIAAEKKQKEETDKKKLEESKKKAEADKKRKAEEALKKAEADKKRKNDELKRKEAERKLAEEKKQLLEAERLATEKRKAAAAERADKMRADITGYIQALIERNWRYPSNTRNGMTAKVLIRLFPSGEIDSVEIIKSSGDAAFDKSTEQAVLRIGKFARVSEVDPLFFERELRRVIIEFRPEGLRW